MVLPQFLLPIPTARVGARSVSARKENQMMWKFFFFLAIVAMSLSKMGGKKIVIAEITCEELKKKSATSTIFLQQITCDLNLTLRLLF